jgi:hypothetical protein
LLKAGHFPSPGMRFPLAAALLLLAAGLAGCSGSPAEDPVDDPTELEVTDSTGGIRGIVVDSSVVPVPDAVVTLSGGKNTTSDAAGLFTFTGLAAGDYFLTVGKPGYRGAQASATVVAGVPDPPIVKVLIDRLSSAQAYLEFFKLDGFYECGFALPFITDSCDFGWRTGYDEVNNTAGSPPPVIPRSPTAFSNTQFIDVGTDTFTIIQEGFWEDEAITSFWVMVDSTPIHNDCDCSDDTYLSTEGNQPLLGRLDLVDDEGTVGEPAGLTVAARGFLPFGDPQYALNFRFTVLTTLFHNLPAPEGWTFETRDQYTFG